MSKQRAAQAEGLPARLMAKVPAGTFGPYLGAARDRKLLVWAQTDAEGTSQRFWYSKLSLARPASAAAGDAGAESKPLRLTRAPDELGLVTVEPVPGAAGSTRAFVVVSTTETETGQELSAFALGPDGQMLSDSLKLADGLNEVLWVAVTTTSSQVLVWWAARDDSGASVSLHALSERFEALAESQQIVAGAVAWQVRGLPSGAVLASVLPREATSRAAAKGAATRGKADNGGAGNGGPKNGGELRLFFVDDTGKPGKEVTVGSGATAERDIDAAVSAQGVWLAWTDQREIEARVYTSLVDWDGTVTVAPVAAAPSISPQALSRLVPRGDAKSSQRPFLVWKEPALSQSLPGAGAGSGFFVAALGENAVAQAPRALLEFGSDEGGAPELAATERGLAALTLAAPCPGERPCDEPMVPTFVEFDEQLRVRRNGPIRPAPMDSFADMAWGLSCERSPCSALVATVTDPAPVYDVELTSEVREWRAPVLALPETSPPHIDSVVSLAETEPLADLAASPLDDKSKLIAWLTDFDPNTPYEKPTAPAPDGRWAPVRARLEVGVLAEDGSLVDRNVVSYRARSVGGVALASHAAQKKSLLAWSALDQQVSQVFVTLLTNRGARINQRMLTRSKGEVLALALAPVSDGFLVAWVDDRRGHPDVYVKKLNLGLGGPAAEQPLTDDIGALSGLALERVGDQLWLAWAESGGGAAAPRVVLRQLDPKTGAPQGEAISLPAAAGAQSLVLAQRAGGVVVGWAEPEGAAGDQRLQLRLLDTSGGVQGQATLEGEGSRDGLSIECGAETCRGLSLLRLRGRDLLEPWSWSGTGAPAGGQRVPFLAEHGARKIDLAGDFAALADLANGKGRLRLARIRWQ